MAGLGRGYQITIVDHGLGMTSDDIERANQRLAGTESFTVTPAKYLGHYVTAVLAARHDIKVTLQGSVVVGIAALVELPAAFIADGADASPPAPATGATGPRNAPNADDVRRAVAELRRARPSATAAAPAVAVPAVAAVAASPAAQDDPAAEHPLPGWARPVATLSEVAATPTSPAAPTIVRLGAATNGDDDARSGPEGPPERTASGLVRRVRGAHVPVGAAVARAATGEPAPSAPPDEPSSSAPVDGAEIQRFLTSLVGGVQRSLDEQSPAAGAGDED